MDTLIHVNPRNVNVCVNSVVVVVVVVVVVGVVDEITGTGHEFVVHKDSRETLTRVNGLASLLFQNLSLKCDCNFLITIIENGC